jgi:hypothetical protein
MESASRGRVVLGYLIQAGLHLRLRNGVGCTAKQVGQGVAYALWGIAPVTGRPVTQCPGKPAVYQHIQR